LEAAGRRPAEEADVTESEWLITADAMPMLKFLLDGGGVSPRKLRLWAVACCRRVWRHIAEERNRRALVLAERYADDETAVAELQAALRAVHASGDVPAAFGDTDREALAALAAAGVRGSAALATVTAATNDVLAAEAAITATAILAVRKGGPQVGDAARAAHAALLRDIFGPLPFRRMALDPSCLTPATQALARAAYDDRLLPSGHLDAGRLSRLADGLEQEGCSDAVLLGHLRGPGPHVRGCFALDLLLGKW
jgi:hypothetical protein